MNTTTLQLCPRTGATSNTCITCDMARSCMVNSTTSAAQSVGYSLWRTRYQIRQQRNMLQILIEAVKTYGIN